MRTDKNLCRVVFREIVAECEIIASLTRFGGLAVFVHTADYSKCLWQGDNILEARAFIASRPVKAAPAPAGAAR